MKEETIQAMREKYPDMDSIINDPEFETFVGAHIRRIDCGRNQARDNIRIRASEKHYINPIQFKRTPWDWFRESGFSNNGVIEAFKLITKKQGGYSRSQRDVITSIIKAAATNFINSKAKDHEAANVIRATVAHTKRAPSGSKGKVCNP